MPLVPQATPGRQAGAYSPPLVAQAAAAKTRKAKPKPAPAKAAVADAARQRYSGAYSGALNNLDDAEQRVAAVARRRQQDAQQYAAYVLGQQGSIAAASAAADQKSLDQHGAIQQAALQGSQALQQSLQDRRNEAAGVGRGTNAGGGGPTPVPAQQLSGLVDEQTRTQQLLAASGGQQADAANTNQGRAAFLAAAAKQQLAANQRAIAGDEFDQTSGIRREKTGVLSAKTESTQADKRAAGAAAASIVEAQMRAQAAADDRASREAISSNSLLSRKEIAAAQISNAQLQGRANRRTRIKTAGITAAAGGYVTPAERRRRNVAISNVKDNLERATQRAGQLMSLAGKVDPSTGKPNNITPDILRADIMRTNPDVPKEVRELIVAQMFKREPGKAAKGTAQRRYEALLKKIAAGEL